MARKETARGPGGALSALDALFDRAAAPPAPGDGLTPEGRDVARRLAALSQEERMAVMREYCRECGSDDPRCVCWRDD